MRPASNALNDSIPDRPEIGAPAPVAERLQNRTLALAGVMHDLRRPLTRLRLRMELLDESTRAEAASDVAEMEAMIAAALNALCDLTLTEPLQWIDLNAMLSALLADVRRMGCKAAIYGRVRAPYPGQPVMLRRCLGNLIDNAFKFAGAAAIHVRDEDSCVRITVKDRGPGIPHDELERVFEPFYRASAAHRTEGAGLGLWIAREGAFAHGGALVLRNSPKRGAEAEVTLPRAHATVGAVGQRSLRSVPITESAPATNMV